MIIFEIHAAIMFYMIGGPWRGLNQVVKDWYGIKGGFSFESQCGQKKKAVTCQENVPDDRQ